MVDWEFEKFMLEQVRRERALYSCIMIAFAGCAIACLVMSAAALILFRTEAAGTSLKLILLVPLFAGMSFSAGYAAQQSRKATEEIEDAIDNPESNAPENYTKRTKDARRAACRNLHSIRGLIISYGIIALLLWAVTVLIAGLAVNSGLSYGLLFVSFVTFSMALGLTILTIAYLCDLPAARRYRQLIDRND